jgi:uncharacterized protein
VGTNPDDGSVWMPLMVMSTVHLPDELVDRLAVEAARRGISVDALAAETLAAAFDQPVTPIGPRRRLAFVAIGASGQPRGGAEADDLLPRASGATECCWSTPGPFVAAADTDDAHHHACRVLLEDNRGPRVTSPMAIAEAAYLLDRQIGPAALVALFASITEGSLQMEKIRDQDWARICELVAAFADLRLGRTDASLVALAERLGVGTIATLKPAGLHHGPPSPHRNIRTRPLTELARSLAANHHEPPAGQQRREWTRSRVDAEQHLQGLAESAGRGADINTGATICVSAK